MRYELKYIITPAQYILLKSRLSPFMRIDGHACPDNNYFIRSIYFDSEQFDALREKSEGVKNRRKYRLRFYNGETGNCRLECKIKADARIEKKSLSVAEETVRMLLKGGADPEHYRTDNLVGELQILIQNRRFRPVVTVDYLREAYLYPTSDVRITFDKEIAAGTVADCLTKERCLPNILPDGEMVLEVKYDRYLPAHISHIISSVRPVQTAASKYVMCVMKEKERGML